MPDAAQWAIAKVYDNTFSEIGGTATSLGVAENAVGLPTAESSWRFETFTVEDYNALFEQVLSGAVTIDSDYEKNLEQDYSNLNLNII